MTKQLVLFWVYIFIICFPAISKATLPDKTVKNDFSKKHFASPSKSLPNIFKKLADKLKFTKNIRSAEKVRILKIIDALIKNDSIMASRNIRILNDTLRISQNKTLTELLNRIKVLESSAIKTTSVSETVDDQTNFIPDNEPLNEKELIARIIAELNAKDDQNKQGDKEKKLIQIKASANWDKDSIHLKTAILKLKNGTKIRYKIVLKNKAMIIGYQPFWFKEEYLNYNFNLLDEINNNYFELKGIDGSFTERSCKYDSEVILAARNAHCKINVIIEDQNSKDVKTFLNSKASQIHFINSAISVIEKKKISGVIVRFIGLTSVDRKKFVDFIAKLSLKLKTKKPSITLSIDLPAFDKDQAYDLSKLNNLTDRFFISNLEVADKQDESIPYLPLHGNFENNLTKCIQQYLNKGISASKFIIKIPYYGVKCMQDNNSTKVIKSNFYFRDIMKDLESHTEESIVYDDKSCCMYIKKTDGTIWFDNEKSLSIKYDYILKNQLGGIALCNLGYDDGYTELWDALADKFVKIDTIYLDTIIPHKPIKQTFLKYLQSEFKFYHLVFQHPGRYSSSQFKLDYYLSIFNLNLLGVIILLSGWFVVKKKQLGEEWKWQSFVSILLFLLVALLMVTGLLYFFLDANTPSFGIYAVNSDDFDKNINDAKVAIINNEIPNVLPFSAILAIMGAGFGIGALMAGLLVPYFKKNYEKP